VSSVIGQGLTKFWYTAICLFSNKLSMRYFLACTVLVVAMLATCLASMGCDMPSDEEGSANHVRTWM